MRNGRLKLEGFFTVGIHRSEDNFTVTILSTSTRLFCVLTVNVNFFGNSLFVSNLRCTYISFYLELTKQTVYDNFQMQLTHTSDNGLAGFLICMRTEGRVFFCKFCKSFAHFALSGFGLGLDSQLDNRLRELHRLQDYRMLLITDGITSCCEFESNSCCDISGIYFIQFLSLISVHLQDTSYTLFFIFCRVQYIRTRVHSTRIYTEESKLSYKRVSHDLECQSRERLFIRRVSYYFISIQVSSLDRRDIQR